MLRLAFISTPRLPEGRLLKGFIRGAPDLAVEVLSPSDNPVDVQQKVRGYLEAGTRFVWVIAHEARTATSYRAEGSARLLREGAPLDGEDVLPGLMIRLGEILA
jgi:Uma2 family endonuclease